MHTKLAATLAVALNESNPQYIIRVHQSAHLTDIGGRYAFLFLNKIRPDMLTVPAKDAVKFQGQGSHLSPADEVQLAGVLEAEMNASIRCKKFSQVYDLLGDFLDAAVECGE
jgi:hypothetical protein